MQSTVQCKFQQHHQQSLVKSAVGLALLLKISPNIPLLSYVYANLPQTGPVNLCHLLLLLSEMIQLNCRIKETSIYHVSEQIPYETARAFVAAFPSTASQFLRVISSRDYIRVVTGQPY